MRCCPPHPERTECASRARVKKKYVEGFAAHPDFQPYISGHKRAKLLQTKQTQTKAVPTLPFPRVSLP